MFYSNINSLNTHCFKLISFVVMKHIDRKQPKGEFMLAHNYRLHFIMTGKSGKEHRVLVTSMYSKKLEEMSVCSLIFRLACTEFNYSTFIEIRTPPCPAQGKIILTVCQILQRNPGYSHLKYIYYLFKFICMLVYAYI